MSEFTPLSWERCVFSISSLCAFFIASIAIKTNETYLTSVCRSCLNVSNCVWQYNSLLYQRLWQRSPQPTVSLALPLVWKSPSDAASGCLELPSGGFLPLLQSHVHMWPTGKKGSTICHHKIHFALITYILFCDYRFSAVSINGSLGYIVCHAKSAIEAMQAF